jgi:hypothetical protein
MKGVFNKLTSAQIAFIKKDQVDYATVIPCITSDTIVARGLVKLGLLATSPNGNGASSTNVGSNARTLVALSKRFDPVSDVVANGVKIIGLLANVHASIAAGLGPQRYVGDITQFNQSNYDIFGRVVGASPYYQSRKAENLATLAKAGFSSSGNPAQDVWTTHIIHIVIMVGAEGDRDVAIRNGTETVKNPGPTGPALQQSNTDLMMHAPQLAGLFSLSLGVPTERGTASYPRPNLL